VRLLIDTPQYVSGWDSITPARTNSDEEAQPAIGLHDRVQITYAGKRTPDHLIVR